MKNHILLVEDSAADRELIRRALQEHFTIVEVATLAEAITHLDGGGFDCVLLDLGLPDSPYAATLGALKARYPTALVVVLSGFDHPETIQDSLAHGAVGYLIKGRDDKPERMVPIIRHAIHRRVQELTQPPSVLPSVPAAEQTSTE